MPQSRIVESFMRGWTTLLRMVHDNIGIIFFGLLVGLLAVGWLIIEAFRGHRSRAELSRLRHRLVNLERERAAVRMVGTAPVLPVVMPDRWVSKGSTATTSDGGCLILVDNLSAAQHTALLTIRVDGYAVKRNESLRVGGQLAVSGKSGTYLVELHGADASQACLRVALRSKHMEYAADTGPRS